MKRLNQYSCALLAAGCISMIAWAAELPSQKESALKLTIEKVKTISGSSDGVSFSVSFHNSSPTNLLLNTGGLLGNGSQIWSSLKAELKTEGGQRLPMTLGWGVPGVAGRIYFLGVPLRSGSSYVLPVKEKDYYVGTGDRLKPGKYEIYFVYRGQQSDYRDSTQMPACWEGQAQSNTLKFEVMAE
jgi:hypothetical protein